MWDEIEGWAIVFAAGALTAVVGVASLLLIVALVSP